MGAGIGRVVSEEDPRIRRATLNTVWDVSLLAFTCSELAMEILEQSVKYVQS